MRMTLLRSPRWPDPEADVGHHELAFAIHPHRGGWQEAGVTAEALCFNAPLLLGEGAGEPHSWFSTDTPGLLVDTVKRAEDGDELIVRLYEAHGGRGSAACASASRSPTRGSPTCWRTASAPQVEATRS